MGKTNRREFLRNTGLAIVTAVYAGKTSGAREQTGRSEASQNKREVNSYDPDMVLAFWGGCIAHGHINPKAARQSRTRVYQNA